MNRGDGVPGPKTEDFEHDNEKQAVGQYHK